MGCASGCVRWLLFVFNFLFALGGLAILVVGVLIRLNQGELLSLVEHNVPVSISMPATVLIVVGAIIFVIAFFGCCGAARESHCMIVTFAVLLLTLLVVQVAIATFTFIKMKDGDFDDKFNEEFKKVYRMSFEDYEREPKKAQAAADAVNSIQALVECCGFNSYTEFNGDTKNPYKGKIPYSCCGKKPLEETCVPSEAFKTGCEKKVVPYIHRAMDTLGGLALGIAAVELIGVIFSFCLANSIRNVERRGYKV